MGTHYHQLTQEQRYQIWGLHNSGRTLSEIGTTLGCHKSTVSRELRRNRDQECYEPKQAHILSVQRKRQAWKSSKQCVETDRLIAVLIQRGWSPAALSVRMKIEPSYSGRLLSHTTIYQRIAADKRRGGKLYRYLPRFGKKRWKGGKRNKQAGAKLIPDRVDISQRPAVVDKRSRLGDWEGDMVHGQSAHLVTLVERSSRFTLVRRVFSKQKKEVADAMIGLLSQVSKKRTLTLDNGGEFADHVRVSQSTGARIFFARPYASWQRGTNENTNGRIRRFWPKKFDLGTLSDQQIAAKIWLLNFTPRLVLGGLTPIEVLTGKRVALIT